MSVLPTLKEILPEGLKQTIRHVQKRIRPSAIELSLKKELGEKVFFVQVGSNDGKQGDPLYEMIKRNAGWRGIFVEPIPYLFKRLKQNYGIEDRFRFVNVAISKEAGDRDIYYVAPSARRSLKLPFWYDQLGSFDPAHIRKHFGDKVDGFIVSESIPCKPLGEVLASCNVQEIDLFHVDTEGYDYQVLQQFAFTKFQPKIVIYEHKHLSETEKRSSSDLLVTNGYQCIEVGGDTLAVRRRG